MSKLIGKRVKCPLGHKARVIYVTKDGRSAVVECRNHIEFRKRKVELKWKDVFDELKEYIPHGLKIEEEEDRFIITAGGRAFSDYLGVINFCISELKGVRRMSNKWIVKKWLRPKRYERMMWLYPIEEIR